MKMKNKESKPKQQTVEAVHTHTHTHTHTDTLLNGRKIGVAIVCLIAIICGAIFFTNKNGIMKSPMLIGSYFGRNRIGEGTGQEGSGAFSLGSNEKVGNAVDTSKWDMTRVDVVLDTDNIPVPVPKGFTASGATGEHTVNTGFVIYEGTGEINDDNAWDESCTRNQFVWVPVPDPSRVYEEIGTTGKKKAKLWNFTSTGRTQIENTDTVYRREPGILSDKSFDNNQIFVKYGMQGYTKENFYQELITSFDRDIESIKKYGGFYIGRYETGNISSEQPVVQRMNIMIIRQNWYEMYPRMKNISTNENADTSMIWGCLWDETLQWIIDTETKTQEEVCSDSSSWGNYSGTTFEYLDVSGNNSTKNRLRNEIIPTGSTERNKANNIYDLAGNTMEKTMEKYARGGCAFLDGKQYSNSSNRDYDKPSLRISVYGDVIGVRTVMYLK